MSKYRVIMPYKERIIEADDADDACQRFVEDDNLFEFLECEEIKEPAPEPHQFRAFQVIDFSKVKNG